MKKIFLLGVFALLSTTLFSCSADEDASDNQSQNQIKKEVNTVNASASEEGPGDDPVIIQPPKK